MVACGVFSCAAAAAASIAPITETSSLASKSSVRLRCMQQEEEKRGALSSVTAAEGTITASVVDNLKLRVRTAVDSGNFNEASELITSLKDMITKELLEATRIGAFVNELRKSYATTAPEFSKECRRVIKSWQQVAEIKHCVSAASSINGTPSPSVASNVTPGRVSNRLTPRTSGRRTPGAPGQLTTPNAEKIPFALHGTRSSTTSPAATSSGRKATKCVKNAQDISLPNGTTGSLHKSQTVGTDLMRTETTTGTVDGMVRNGKRRTEKSIIDTGSSCEQEKSLARKRLRCAQPAVTSAAAQASQKPQSLMAARRANVQSTCEIVANLIENLPESLSINFPKREDVLNKVEHQCSRSSSRKPEMAAVSRTAALTSDTCSDSGRKQAKRGRKKKVREEQMNDGQAEQPKMFSAKITKNGVKFILKSDDDDNSKDKETSADVKFEPDGKKSKSDASHTSRCEQEVSDADKPNASCSATSSKEKSLIDRKGKYDWYSILPSLETLRNRNQLLAKRSRDPRASYIMTVRGREVLALPYVDTGKPDFLEYNYPDKGRFYAEENFIYGAPRPS